ncbi:3',5'-cyclic AMP phosphodiesterase CpdA [Oceanibaculum indicum]|uniref:3',5'-cyclic AMP phosphodiesterase CpdA n=2 Tax=Oceanibaculum indicum TaxID=526216 RepID=A0A420WMR1_9PROT|nr:3',5'-cyclic AMP phosphodiesterase CpdA [Oceanibaculum indicum]
MLKALKMKLIHLTDTHLVRAGELLYGLDPKARLDACIADINRNHGDADLAVITGDLTHFGDREAFQALRQSLDALTVPVQLIVGNHDTNDVFRDFFPDVPVDEAGAVQSVRDTQAGRLIFLDTTKTGTHAGWYDEARLDWLEARIAESGDAPIFLFMHHPPLLLGVPAMDRIGLMQRDLFNARMTPYLPRIRHVFFGHIHRPVSGSWRGVPFSTLRAMSHQVWLDFSEETEGVPGSHEPPAYAIVLIEPEQVVIHFHDFLDDSRKFNLRDVEYGFWDEQERRLSAAE